MCVGGGRGKAKEKGEGGGEREGDTQIQTDWHVSEEEMEQNPEMLSVSRTCC